MFSVLQRYLLIQFEWSIHIIYSCVSVGRLVSSQGIGPFHLGYQNFVSIELFILFL